MLDASTIKQFEDALLVGPRALKELAMSMASAGLSQAAICHHFDLFGRHLRTTGRDDGAALIWVSIENIVGWRSRESCWFDHYLTNEELDEYRRSIDAPLRPIFHVDPEHYRHDL